jgi:group I intron endonuclease
MKYKIIRTPFKQSYNSVSSTYICKRTIFTSSSLEPVKVYLNPDKEKELIIRDNKDRTGVYRWVNLDSGKSYIGSSSNLSARFKQYFNYNHISYPKRNLRIYKALLKYGYSGFRLEILEYCYLEILLEREQFYFDTLNPEYNILKVAGSPLGYRHSEAAKKLISIKAKNRKVLESTREIKRRILLGKTLNKEHIENLRLGNTLRKSVIVTDIETGNIKEFISLTEAGEYLGISRITVGKYLSKGTLYNKYKISSPNSNSNETQVSSNVMRLPQQPVLLNNIETGDKKEFVSMTEAAKYLNVSRARLWYFLHKTEDGTLKGYSISKLENLENEITRGTKRIEVTDLVTNEVTIYPSFTLAAKYLNIPQSSISGYFAKQRVNPFRKRYIFKLV